MSAHPPHIRLGPTPCGCTLCALAQPRRVRRDLRAGWPGPRRVTARPASTRPRLCQHPSMLPHPRPCQHVCVRQCGATRVGALAHVGTAPPRVETPARWLGSRRAAASSVSTWRRPWPRATKATLVRSMGAHQPRNDTGEFVRRGFFEFPKFTYIHALLCKQSSTSNK